MGITHPVGIDLHLPGEQIPETMRRHLTHSTPEMANMDRQCIVWLQSYDGFDLEIGECLIDRLWKVS